MYCIAGTAVVKGATKHGADRGYIGGPVAIDKGPSVRSTIAGRISLARHPITPNEPLRRTTTADVLHALHFESRHSLASLEHWSVGIE
jgi:hypothetical protein